MPNDNTVQHVSPVWFKGLHEICK